jgi:hypothetical protein
MMLSLPLASRALSTTFFMSEGARNWPFLMFTGLPGARDGVDEIRLAAEERRRLQHVDDLRHRGTSSSVCTSVSTGTPRDFFTLARISRPFSMPGPRYDLPLERFALSYDDLKMNGMPSAPSSPSAARHVHLELLALDDAGTGDEEERLLEPTSKLQSFISRMIALPGETRCAPTRSSRRDTAGRFAAMRSRSLRGPSRETVVRVGKDDDGRPCARQLRRDARDARRHRHALVAVAVDEERRHRTCPPVGPDRRAAIFREKPSRATHRGAIGDQPGLALSPRRIRFELRSRRAVVRRSPQRAHEALRERSSSGGTSARPSSRCRGCRSRIGHGDARGRRCDRRTQRCGFDAATHGASVPPWLWPWMPTADHTGRARKHFDRGRSILHQLLETRGRQSPFDAPTPRLSYTSAAMPARANSCAR